MAEDAVAPVTGRPCRVAPSWTRRGFSSGSPTSGAGQAVSVTTARASSIRSSPATALCSLATRLTRSAPPSPSRLSQARPGDLLFFAGPHGTGEVDHVAIYAGGGLMIDAPYTGAFVEEIPMRIVVRMA